MKLKDWQKLNPSIQKTLFNYLKVKFMEVDKNVKH